jgi:hypothetical protein
VRQAIGVLHVTKDVTVENKILAMVKEYVIKQQENVNVR